MSSASASAVSLQATDDYLLLHCLCGNGFLAPLSRTEAACPKCGRPIEYADVTKHSRVE